MELDELCRKLIDLYNITFDYEFHRSSYEKYMESLMTDYAELFRKTAQACDSSEDILEQIAFRIPEYIQGELEKIPKKREREMAALDHRMNMVAYYVPLLGEIPSVRANDLLERTVDIWNEKMPDNKIKYSTYEFNKRGFKKGIFCYITTAVCRSMNRPDDCYELETLRNYRDDYLIHTPGGREIVEEYYNVAPTIVKRINRQADADKVYREIWGEYLNPCIRLIEEGRREECRKLYTEMVEKLEDKYLYS
nr:CFI-box-CTERM domain-containing protein [uncultured Mediterraneibacter sp.]